ncbi:GntR family transcriptional regulator [Phycicoccus ginsengisoli]
MLAGTYPADVALPTEAELALQYGVSRQTVRRAFQDLVAEGLVSRTPGRGTFAVQNGRYLRQFGSVEDLMALSADSQMQLLDPLRDVIDPTAAGRLRLGDDHVARAVFVRLHRGEAFSHTTVFLPPAVGARLGEVRELTAPGSRSQVTVIALLDETLARPIQDAEQSITVARAPEAVAEGLDLAPATPVLRIDRTYFDTSGTPVELAISHFHPDRYSYRVRLRRNPG